MGIIDSLVENVGLRNATIFIDDLSGRKDGFKHDEITRKKKVTNPASAMESVQENLQSSAQEVAEEAKKKAAETAIKAAAPGASGGTVSNLVKLFMNRTPSNPNVSKIEGATQRIFEVQINPNTLTLSAFGGGKASSTNFTNDSDKAITYDVVKPNIQLSVMLVFDDSPDYQFDLFAKTTAGEAGKALIQKGINAAADGLNKLAGKKKFSVKDRVEAFLAALRNPDTVNITFCWGAMAYFGVLNGVNAKYTLFDYHGIPVRANVEFNMICLDASVTAGNLGYWRDQYKQI